jgi:hypothetical protein
MSVSSVTRLTRLSHSLIVGLTSRSSTSATLAAFVTSVLTKLGMKHLIDAVVGGIVKYFVPKVLDWLLGLCNKRRRKRLC